MVYNVAAAGDLIVGPKEVHAGVFQPNGSMVLMTSTMDTDGGTAWNQVWAGGLARAAFASARAPIPAASQLGPVLVIDNGAVSHPQVLKGNRHSFEEIYNSNATVSVSEVGAIATKAGFRNFVICQNQNEVSAKFQRNFGIIK